MSEFDDKTPSDAVRRIPRTQDELASELLSLRTEFRVFKRETRGQLSAGAGSMAGFRQKDEELGDRIESLKEENRVKPWKVVVGALSFVAVLASAFIAVGRYSSDSKHTTDAVQTQGAKIDSLDAKVRDMDKEQGVLTEKVGTMDKKVDEIKKAVVPPPPPAQDFSGRRRAR